MIHLTDQEIIALNDGSFNLLIKTKQHIKTCNFCQKGISIQQNSSNFLSDLCNVTPISLSEKKLTSIADTSFSYINSDIKQKQSPSFSFFKFSLQGAALLLIVSFSVIMLSDYFKVKQDIPQVAKVQKQQVPIKIRNSKSTQVVTVKKLTETLSAQFKSFKKDRLIKIERSEIRVVGTSMLKKIDENNIAIKDGKIDVHVKKGSDFIVQVGKYYLVRVLGTKFTIHAEQDDVTVNVTEGLVELIDKRTNASFTLAKDMSKSILAIDKNLKEETPSSHHVKLPHQGRKSKNSLIRSGAMKGVKKKLLREKLKKIVQAVDVKKEVKLEINNDQYDDQEVIVVENVGDFGMEKPVAPTELHLGRKALLKNDFKNALAHFRKELKSGSSKDKALFEIIRIMEKKKKFKTVLSKLRENTSIILSKSLYKEEFLIKGCKAEVKLHDSDKIFCNEYIDTFPDGYKNEEIRKVVGR